MIVRSCYFSPSECGELGKRDQTTVSVEVKKAVIPAAGKGMRLTPMTTHMPKELLPVGGKPMIQHTIEMCMASGITELCIITSPEKPLLKNFVSGNWRPPSLPFQWDAGFYRNLRQCNVTVLNQQQPKGVAHAVSLARQLVGDDPFVCIMPDCLLFSRTPFARQLMRGFAKYRKHIIGTIYIQHAEIRRFGNVGMLKTDRLQNGCFSITALSDKTNQPLSAKAGEKIHKGFGGGIYLPEYFDLIDGTRTNANGEVDDVPIHQRLVEAGALLGGLLEGVAFDAGHPMGYRAAVHFAGRLA